jgi:hypothetical protein
MSTRKRRNARSARVLNSAEIQVLETKSLPTGTVTVSLSGSGDLYIRGDNNPNELEVQVFGGQLSVTGLNNTLIKLGNAAPAANISVPVPAVLRDVKIDLRGGDDVLSLTSVDALDVERNLDINTGSGNDEVEIFAENTLSVGRNAWIYTEGGNDIVSLNTLAGGSFVIGRDAEIKTGSGEDAVALVDRDRFSGVTNTADLLAVPNNTATAGAQSIRAGRDLKISTQGDNDKIAVLGAEAGRDFSILSGFGRGDVLGVSNLRAGRDLTLNDGDENVLQNVTVVRTLSINSGNGNDRFAIDRVNVRNLNIQLGSGNDQLSLGANVTVTSQAKINGNGGQNKYLKSGTALAGAKIKNMRGVLTLAESNDILDDAVASLVNSGLI